MRSIENLVKRLPCLMGWVVVLNLAWLLLAGLTAWQGWRSYTLTVNGEAVTGTVVLLVKDNITAFDSDIFPVVEFEVEDQIYSVRSQNNYRWWNQHTRFPVGRQVEMRYDPANPETAEINSWRSRCKIQATHEL